MKKKTVGMLVCTMLIAAAVLPVTGTFEINRKSAIGFRFKSFLNPHPSYVPVDIDLEDAAFHRSYDRFLEEWWYFEAIFDNGYSIVLSIVIFSKGFHGICSAGMVIYNNTQLEFQFGKKAPFKEFNASEEFPFINVSGKQIIRLDRERYNNTGEWVYNVSFEFDNQKANLQFTGVTKGFKAEILKGWYGPVLPKATVNGTLILNGDKIDVSGLGYHEHAWEIAFAIREWGWYWSKIVSDSYILMWAKLMNTRWWEQTRTAVFSQDQAGYINIDPENFKLKATKYVFDHRRLIPTKFILNITDSENSIYINATIEVMNTHHYGKLIVHYWRYHLKINGEITYRSTTEKIKDQIQIMELIRFR